MVTNLMLVLNLVRKSLVEVNQAIFAWSFRRRIKLYLLGCLEEESFKGPKPPLNGQGGALSWESLSPI